ncbi:hypothetical protein L5515_009028 [Caenorhabditis briggsae]|uniref:T20D4.11-like domain-containing protein n=1 Tax=Caenorhabditis briggsae TaxID=6238 RepID=A0AAE9FAF6_CAEBR|nr:hypothetical protein L5515_009028 [Caenorhabditis briggsae]
MLEKPCVYNLLTGTIDVDVKCPSCEEQFQSIPNIEFSRTAHNAMNDLCQSSRSSQEMLIHLISFAFFFGFALSSQSPPHLPQCTHNETLKALLTCNPMRFDIMKIREKYSDSGAAPEFYKEIDAACELAMECYEPLKCHEARRYRVALDEACDFNIWMFPENRECLMSFFSAAYNAPSLPEPPCLLQYPFMENDTARRHTAYTDGKYCFMDYVKNNCSWNSHHYFSKRYEKIVNAISIDPRVNDCGTEYQQMKHMRCHVLLAETEKRIKNRGFFDRLFGGSQSLAVEKACEDIRECIAGDECFSSSVIPTKIQQLCGNAGQ